MTTQKLTAAQEYAKLKADQFEAFLENSFTNESLKGVPLFEVKTAGPGCTGLTVKCRKLDAAYAAQTGSMPMSLAEAMINGVSDDNAAPDDEAMQAAFLKQTAEERRANILETIKMIAYICVEPRIVEHVGNRTNAIAVNDLAVADVKFLAEWAKTGGGEAPGLKTFRSKRK
jgi:hypothetical protein